MRSLHGNVTKPVNCSFCGLEQEGLEFGDSHFDRIVIGTAGQKVADSLSLRALAASQDPQARLAGLAGQLGVLHLAPHLSARPITIQTEPHEPIVEAFLRVNPFV